MKKFSLLSAVSILAVAFAFDSQAGWKLDADGKIEMKDGNPIYVDGSGKEAVVNGDTISRLNGEAKNHREAKEAAERKLKEFEGIDPEKARKAIEDIKKIDSKTLIDAGEVDKVRKEISDQFTAQLAEKDKVIGSLTSEKENMLIDSVFAGSEFIRDSINVPRDIFQDSFRKNFKVIEGKVVAVDKNGNQIYSKQNTGDYATPEEALKILVDLHPQKETILRADIGSGSGSGGKGGNSGIGRVMKRSEYDALDANRKATIAGQVGKGEIKLVD